MLVLSARSVDPILQVLGTTCDIEATADLGRTTRHVKVVNDCAHFPDGETLTREDLDAICADTSTVWVRTAEQLRKAAHFCESTSAFYKLHATNDWPSLEINGVTMHKIADSSPRLDAQAKVKHFGNVRGHVLDTCCGLGYTATVASRRAASVLTCERDDNVIDMCRINPYSQALFEAGNIELRHADVTEAIRKIEDNHLAGVIHDPPIARLSGELYSVEFYCELMRVLKPGGRLLHYTGNAGSQHGGKNILSSTAGRLRRLGFARIRMNQEFGVLSCVCP